MSTAPQRAAYTLDGADVARERFYAIACDPQRSVVVEACAGAGKTWMLVSRILRALLAGAQPHEILAITFTRKAAGEMRARLSEWLAEFAAPACDAAARVKALRERGLTEAEAVALAPALAALQGQVLRAGRPVEIRTFHAWFSQLLRAAPLELLDELGLQPDMDLLEDVNEHADEVYRRFHLAVLAEPARHADYLQLVQDRGRAQLRAWLDAAWSKRIEIELADAAGTLERSVPAAAEHWPEYAGLVRPTQRLLAAPAQAMLGAAAAALMREAGAIPRKQGALLAQAIAMTDDAACHAAAWAALFTQKGELRKKLDAPGVDEAAALLEHVATAGRQQQAHLEHRRMVGLARVLLREFAAYKRSRGLADMADLERCALALLRDSALAGWVQERLDARIRHLLIDEFQDTSPLQWQALEAWLSAYAGAGGGASGQRPPGVFIVGDPKQSIYRFRRAEPRVFEAARAFVVDGLAGSALACDHTRRNAPGVLVALNAVFSQAQGEGAFTGFRAHTTEVAGNPAPAVFVLPPVPRPPKAAKDLHDGDDGTPWRESLVTPRREPDAVLREAEAALVADAVSTLIAAQQVRPSEIQVLCRKRASLRLLAQALAARRVPFAAAEDHALMAAPEVRDLVALLDVLASPQHSLSLAHALRCPVFGASDDDLIALANRVQADGGDLWGALQALPEPSAALQRARVLLQDWRRAAQELPPHDLLDRIVAEGQVRERYAAAVPAALRPAALAAIDALLGQTLIQDGARYATPYNFVRALRRGVHQAAAPVHADAVQLLTVHGAKGLEARFVFVMDADPEPKKPDNATLLVAWPVESGHPTHCAFLYSESRCPPSLANVFDHELAARRREELNGLYVAMSRARERLVFSATAPYQPPKEPSWWQRVEPQAQPWPLAPGLSDVAPAAVGPTDMATVATLPAATWLRAAAAPATPAAGRADDAQAGRLGEAVHRTLEWAAEPGRAEAVDIELLASAAAQAFGVERAAVARAAGNIWRSAECAPFLRGPALRWAGNEVPVSDAGDVLRIDRLVERVDAGVSTWWVLDYKLQRAPQHDEAHRAQLLRYRSAVQALQPGAPVRCAFITGEGALIEIA